MSQHQTFPPVNHDPETWIRLIFSAQAAKGGVVRRSIAWVDREVGRDRFVEEVRRRGFHLLQTSNQFIVVCNRDAVTLVF
ncbi:MAG: N-(5'-phosphoribosyl)anthranilate isomerase [Tabrizicola sp.]|jgi:hypothetical protein|nr:N-(5'-phosphoribosyl)anthranilate isomerase [Tabrizicola sp.]